MVKLMITMELDQSVERGDVIRQCSRLTYVPEKTDPIPNITLPYLHHVEYADADTNVVEGAIHVFLVQVVDEPEGLFWRETKLRGRGVSGSCPIVRKAIESAVRVRKEGEKVLRFILRRPPTRRHHRGITASGCPLPPPPSWGLGLFSAGASRQ